MTNCRFKVATRNEDGSISISEVPRLRQNGSRVVRHQKRKNDATQVKFESRVEIGKVVLTIPMRTKSEANCFDHWRMKHDRHLKQQAAIAFAMKPIRNDIKLPCKITLTRIAPKMLDEHDNLPMSFKYIVDAVCAILTGNYKAGKADSDKRISIAYAQIQSKQYGIRIELTF